jgi:hypothetical protein
MAFITEFPSEQDIEKYQFRAINDRVYGGRNGTGIWTIDRDQDIYIRPMRYSREQPIDITYSFFWKGVVLRVVVRSHTYEGEHGGPVHATVELLPPPIPGRGMPAIVLPPELEVKREQITNDFKAAFVAEKSSNSAGVFTAFSATFI